MIIRHEIRVQVEGLVNGNLEIDELEYHPLLSVSIRRARLVSNGAVVAELGGLDVNLARIPAGGPIVVDSLTLVDPVIHLTRLATGQIVLQDNLLRPQPPTSGNAKISDTLQIRHFKLRNLTVQVTDQSEAASPTETWARLDASSELNKGTSGYAFSATLADEPLTKVAIDGSMDLDQYAIEFSRLSVSGRIADDRALHQLPPYLQRICRRNGLVGVGGEMAIANGATLFLDASSNEWKLRGLSGDVKLTSLNKSQTVSGHILFSAIGGGPVPEAGSIVGADYLSKLDPDTLMSISVDPKSKLNIISQNMPEPVTDGAGSIEFRNGTLTVNHFGVDYGALPLNLQSTVNASGDSLKVSNFLFNAAGGAVKIDQAELAYAMPRPFKAQIRFEGIDLKKVKNMLALDDPKGRMSGIAGGRMDVSGNLPRTSSLDGITAVGAVHARNGDFFELPVLSDVAARVNPDFRKVGEVGSAGAIFTLKNTTLHFSKLAVSSPLIGVQGYGDIGINPPNALNLNLVLAPLGSWKEKLNGTGIPLLGKLAGKVENAVEKVSQNVLYNFHVTGVAAKPSIQAVPAPALTAEAQNVFGEMLKPAEADLSQLLDPKEASNSDLNK